jgi:hypothetical protein
MTRIAVYSRLSYTPRPIGPLTGTTPVLDLYNDDIFDGDSFTSLKPFHPVLDLNIDGMFDGNNFAFSPASNPILDLDTDSIFDLQAEEPS